MSHVISEVPHTDRSERAVNRRADHRSTVGLRRGRRLASLVSLGLVACLTSGALGASSGQSADFATPTSASSPEGIVAGPDGNLWFTELNAAKVAEVNPATHAISEFSTPTAAAGPLGIALAPDGNLWFTEYQANKVAEINPTTHAISEFPIPTPASGPVGITAGPNGLWFTESVAGKIGEINPTSHVISEFPTPTAASGPFGIAAGPDGNVWFTEKAASKIGQINPATGAISEFPTPTAASAPNEIDAGPDGSLWFTESAAAASRIGEIDPGTHTITEVPLAPASDPLVLATGADGNLWFTENSPTVSQIGQINPVTRAVATFPTPTAAARPTGIAAGADGNLWFTETAVGKVGMIGAGAAAPSLTPPSVVGPAQPGSQLVCQGETWSTWAGLQPSLSAYPFDGYEWLRNGSPIAGATSLSYAPAAADVGQQLSCVVTVTYPLLATTTSAASSPVSVYPTLAASLAGATTSGTGASLTISCQGLPAQTCSGPLQLTAHVTTQSKKPIAVAASTAKKPKPPAKVTTVEKVGSGEYSVAAGSSASVKLALGSTGKSLLDQFYKLPATLTIGGTTSIASVVSFSYGRIPVPPTYTWAWSPSGSIAQELTLKGLPSSSKVTVVCRGHGCPFGEHTWPVPMSHKLVLAPYLEYRRLSPKATVELQITASNDVGEVVNFTIRSGERPSESFECLPPGARSPSKCA
jgi:virginiamycin B lyase